MTSNTLNNKIWEEDMPYLDNELMWEKIKRDINKKKRKPFYIWAIFLVLFLITGTSIYLYLHQTNTVNNKIVNHLTAHIIPKPSAENNFKSQSKFKEKTKVINKFKKTIYKQSKLTFQNPLIDKVYSKSEKIPDYNNRNIHSRQIRDINQLKHKQYLKSNKYFNLKNKLDNKNDFMISNKNKIRNSFFILGLVKIGVPYSITKYNENSKWQTRKINNENVLYNFSSSFLFGKKIYNNLFVSIGMNYQNEVINYIDRDSTYKITKFKSDSAYIFQLSSPMYLPGEKTKINIRYRNLNVYNNIIHWSIPFNLRLKITKTNYNIIFQTGILFRLKSKIRGYTATPYNTTINYQNFQNNIKKYMGISDIIMSGFYSTKFNGNIRILTGLECQFPFKPDYSIISDNAFNVKTIKFNFSVGMKYCFD